MTNTWISSERVLLGGAGRPWRIGPATVELAGREIGVVEEGSRRGGAAPVASAGPVVDLGTRLLTPAFVNPHTHLALGFLRTAAPGRAGAGNMVEELFFRQEEKLRGDDVRAFARMGAWESLLHGVGLVWDHYYFGESVADAMLDVGITGVVAPTLQDLAGPGRHGWSQQLRVTEELAMRTDLEDRAIFAAVGPHATDTVSEELWRRALQLAIRLELPLHAHCAQSLAEYRRSSERNGCSPVDWLLSRGLLEGAPRALLVHALFASARDLAGLSATRDHLVFCPSAQRVFGFPADPIRFTEAGLDWSVATDTSAGNDSMNLQKELRCVAELRTAGVTWRRAWQDFYQQPDLERALAVDMDRNALYTRATEQARGPALVSRVLDVPGRLHPAFRAGTIEPAALANLVVWDLDHPSFWPAEDEAAILQLLAMGDTTQAIHGAWIAGHTVGELGNYHASLLASDAYRESLDEATARRRALFDS